MIEAALLVLLVVIFTRTPKPMRPWKYKSPDVEAGLEGCDPRLEFLLEELTGWARSMGLEVMVTSTARPGDDGPHGDEPCRAADVRTRTWPAGAALAAQDAINAAHDSGGQRTAVYEAPGTPGASEEHLHLQVPRWSTRWTRRYSLEVPA